MDHGECHDLVFTPIAINAFFVFMNDIVVPLPFQQQIAK
jgi:hypothetical protein